MFVIAERECWTPTLFVITERWSCGGATPVLDGPCGGRAMA